MASAMPPDDQKRIGALAPEEHQEEETYEAEGK
jgi:hypothetical protein